MIEIAPSLLAADFLNLEKAVRLVNAHADLFHMDVMDGVFVPNISFGFPVVKAVAARAEKPVDVHLMIVNPEKYALSFASIEAVGMVSFHLDASEDPASLLKQIRGKGVKAGLAINPDKDISLLFPFLQYCDFVLIMSVFAGFGGQSFIDSSYGRITELKAEIERQGLDVDIEVDGGVSMQNAGKLKECGATILVAGTSVFKADNPEEIIAALR